MTQQRGYTLLEMVIVIALFALATGMIAPTGYRMIASWREASDVSQVMRSLTALPLQVRRTGMDLVAAPAETASLTELLALPEGWRIELDAPLTIRANGACSGTSGKLVTARQTLPFTLEAPFCRLGKPETGQG